MLPVLVYYPNLVVIDDFLIQKLVFLPGTKVSHSHLSCSQVISQDRYQKVSFIKHFSGKQCHVVTKYLE